MRKLASLGGLTTNGFAHQAYSYNTFTKKNTINFPYIKYYTYVVFCSVISYIDLKGK